MKRVSREKPSDKIIRAAEEHMDILLKGINESNRKDRWALWFFDYEEAANQYRHWDQAKNTFFSVFFSAIIIVTGIEVSFFADISFLMVSLCSLLSLILIWGWVVIQRRFETGVNVNGIYLKVMEEKLFKNDINSRNFSHKWARKFLPDYPTAHHVYLIITSIFSGFLFWLPLIKLWPDISFNAKLSPYEPIFMLIAIVVPIVASGIIYHLFFLNRPSEADYPKK